MDAEALARRIADCLEQHLHEYGWEPYRYPSGEHKGVDGEFRAGKIWLFGADGSTATLRVTSEGGTKGNHAAND